MEMYIKVLEEVLMMGFVEALVIEYKEVLVMKLAKQLN